MLFLLAIVWIRAWAPFTPVEMTLVSCLIGCNGFILLIEPSEPEQPLAPHIHLWYTSETFFGMVQIPANTALPWWLSGPFVVY
jgi:hypothetical protein